MNDEKKNIWQLVTGILLQPGKTTAWLLQDNHAGWIFPVLITAVMLAAFSAVQHKMVNIQAQQSMPMIDPGAMDLSKDGLSGAASGPVTVYGNGGGGMVVMGEEGDMGMPVQATGESRLTFVLNTVGRVLSYLLIWLILSTSLHLGLMISGGNLQQRSVFHLAAWTGLVIAVRCLIQILYMLVTQQPVLGDGLSGLSGQDTFFSYMLGGLDVYLIWQFVLIFVGFRQTTKLSLQKLGGLAAVNFMLVLLLAAVPPFVINRVLAAVSNSGGLF